MPLGKLVACSLLACSLLVYQAQASVWFGPGGDPPFNGISLPINTSDVSQTKTGGLTISGSGPSSVLSSIFSAVNKQMAIGPAAIVNSDFGNPNSTVRLDVDGQIRIRGGGPNPGEVLKADDITGLASWGDPLGSFFWMESPSGITLTNTEANESNCNYGTRVCKIAVDPAIIQRRITGTCAAGAIKEVLQDGTVTCQPLVSSITTANGSGLTNTLMAGGNNSLSVNAGPGLETTGGLGGNYLRVIPPATGSGLVISSNYLRFATTTPALSASRVCSGANIYWKYDTSDGTWGCGAPSATRLPGNSTMTLWSWSATPTCPSPWVSLGTTAEIVTMSSLPNYGRICGRSVATDLCQTLSLTNSTNLSDNCASAGTPAGCPTGWTDVGLNTVYAPGTPNPPYCNKVRTCYKCN